MTMILPDAPRVDSRGNNRTASLFKEVTQDNNLPPIFTMKDQDTDDCLSAYRIYMESVDEYDAAMALVGSMVRWRKLLQCKWFIEGSAEQSFSGLKEWRTDMEMRDSSRAKRLAAQHLAEGDLKAASLMLDIAAGKKTRQPPTPKHKPTTGSRRGTQNPASVIDIAAQAARIKPE